MRLGSDHADRDGPADRKKLTLAVALSLFPDSYDYGAEFTPERPSPTPVWEIDGEPYRVNPHHLVPQGLLELLPIWRLWQGGAMAPGHLPDSGGTLDQAACMIDAFRVMDRAEARLKKERGE